MEASQLVFENNKEGYITAAGYRIDNLLLQQGQPAAVLAGGGITSIIESLKLGELAVPIGLFYLQDLAKKSSDSLNTSVFELYDEVNNESSNIELVEDSLYDKLLNMVNAKEEPKEKKKNKITRRKRSVASKKTRVKERSTSLD